MLYTSLGGTTYELRDIWNAAWIVMGNVFSWLGDTFSKIVIFMKSVWNSFMELVANNIIVQIFESVFSTVLAFARERDWEQFHAPKNLSMALSAEAAELMEHFLWATPEQSRVSLVFNDGTESVEGGLAAECIPAGREQVE